METASNVRRPGGCRELRDAPASRPKRVCRTTLHHSSSLPVEALARRRPYNPRIVTHPYWSYPPCIGTPCKKHKLDDGQIINRLAPASIIAAPTALYGTCVVDPLSILMGPPCRYSWMRGQIINEPLRRVLTEGCGASGTHRWQYRGCIASGVGEYRGCIAGGRTCSARAESECDTGHDASPVPHSRWVSRA